MVTERTASSHQPHLTSHNHVRTTKYLSSQSFSFSGGLVSISESELGKPGISQSGHSEV